MCKDRHPAQQTGEKKAWEKRAGQNAQGGSTPDGLRRGKGRLGSSTRKTS